MYVYICIYYIRYRLDSHRLKIRLNMCAATRPWPLWAGLYQCLQNVWIQGSWEHGFHLCSIYVIGPSFTIATIILYHIHTMSPYSYPDGPYSFTWQGRFDPRLLFNFLDASHVSGQADQQGPSSDIWHIFRTNQNKSDVIVVFNFFTSLNLRGQLHLHVRKWQRNGPCPNRGRSHHPQRVRAAGEAGSSWSLVPWRKLWGRVVTASVRFSHF